jgi:phage terminase Nu1 subunit (DNA packaging protein)
MNRGMGDRLGQAFAIVGVTDGRVERWLARPCKCKARREKLNQLGRWAIRVLKGKMAGVEAEGYLNEILEQED